MEDNDRDALEKRSETNVTERNETGQPRYRHENTRKFRIPVKSLFVISLIAVTAFFAGSRALAGLSPKTQTITLSSLEKIVELSEINTFQAVYNGVAHVPNEKKPENLDYHVSYQAKVTAGFDLNDIDLKENGDRIILTLPQIKINEVNVDVASLDYIFLNDKANKEGVTIQALKACQEDALEETRKEEAILKLAEENAENIMKALLEPFVDEMDNSYQLTIQFGGDAS